jgi:hypothetical protein
MKPNIITLAAAIVLTAALPAFAQDGAVYNLKLVTDASPDYSDMPSMVHSITSRWETPEQKCFALFYWNHIARRQTTPMQLRGVALTDPIQQFNDYGFTMCSTISGINTATWDFMGLPTRYWEIGLHTVCEVKYDNRWHLYDNSLSAMYTLCDGKTIAGVEDVGAEGACELSGGKVEQGHIAKYHCLNSTSPNGFLEGSDWIRSLDAEANSFNPKNLKEQYFYKCAEYGHRYVLNLRPGETYTRYYHRLDADSSHGANPVKAGKKEGFVHDPAFYVPIANNKGGYDPEASNPRYHIRGNGIRTWTPPLTKDSLSTVAYNMTNVQATDAGVAAIDPAKPAQITFKIEGANVITSMKFHAGLEKLNNHTSLAISNDEGRNWIYLASTDNTVPLNDKLLQNVNGNYSVLFRVNLQGETVLKSITFESTTQLNTKTQPKLNLGKNTIYVGVGGAGDQTETITLFPDLRKGRFEASAEKIENLTASASADYGRYALLYIEDAAVPKGWIDFKVDAPTDITDFTYGGRVCIRAPKSSIEFLHSFDDGKTWISSALYKTTDAPWDQTHYNTITNVPPNTRSIRFRYRLDSFEGTPAMCGLYNVRMEVHHKTTTADVSPAPEKPLNVTYTWLERQQDYSTVKRSHTQHIDKLPTTYTINVGGADHPIMDSLTITTTPAPGTHYGYSDDKDAGAGGGEKWIGTWATYGKNLALHKPYTTSIPSGTNWDAGDPDHTKLTDGRVGSSYNGGSSYKEGLIWNANANPEITVDLGAPQKCAAFRIHTQGYEPKDAIKGQNPDTVEVLTSNDNKNFTSQGFFNFNLRWKDIPVNFMFNDEETFNAHNFFMAPKARGPVEARYIKYKIQSPRMIDVTEVQVLDTYNFKPFDLKIALPEPRQAAKLNP